MKDDVEQHFEQLEHKLLETRQLYQRLKHSEANCQEWVDINRQLRAFVEQYCRDNHMTLEEFAGLAMVSPNTLRRALDQPQKSTMLTINRIAEVCGFTVYLGRK